LKTCTSFARILHRLEVQLESGYNTSMRTRIAILILASLFFSACNLPSRQQLPTADLVGTQVSLVLTGTAGAQPTQPPTTATQPPLPPTETATLEPTATETITPSPTPADDPKAALGAPSWTTNLDNVSSWYTEDNDYSYIRGENGTLALTSKQAIGWHSWTMHYHELTNFYLEATVNVGTCSGNDLYGIIFRAPDTSKGYFYTLTCEGRAGLRAFDGSEFSKVADTISTDALHAGSNQVNRLGVLANGKSITLYANGRKVMEVTDETFSSGTFGAFIAAVNTPGFTIALDDLSYWILP